MTAATDSQQVQDATAKATERPAIRLGGTLNKLHYTDHDWATLKALVITTTAKWPAGRNIAPAEEVQNATLLQFTEQGEAIIKVQQNGDLTPEAKSRYTMNAADAYVSVVGKAVARLNEGMASLADAAPRMLSGVAPLERGDLVGEMRDQELRAIMRGTAGNDRKALMMEINKGDQPSLAAAILRGAPIASGLTTSSLESIRRAGVLASYHEELYQLRDLLLVRDDVIRTAIAGVDALAAIDPGAKSAAIRATSAWRSDEGAEAFRAWLDKLIHG